MTDAGVPPIRIDLSMCSISIFLLKTIFFHLGNLYSPGVALGFCCGVSTVSQCFPSVWKWLVIHNHWKFPFELSVHFVVLCFSSQYQNKLWIRPDCGAIEQHDMVQPYMCSVLYGVGPKTDKVLSRGLMNWVLIAEERNAFSLLIVLCALQPTLLRLLPWRPSVITNVTEGFPRMTI
jgi:hypothetical protein